MAHRRLTAAASVVTALLLTGQCLGAIRPGFELDSCTWNANQIAVVAQSPAANHQLIVRESIRGDLKPGDMVTLADLPVAPLDTTGILNQPPQPNMSTVSGKRMIVFLKSQNALPSADSSSATWVGSNPAGAYIGSRISTVWIDDGHAFAFEQERNAGRLSLTTMNTTESQLRDRISFILDEKDRMAKVLAIADLGQRAEALAEIAASGSWCAKPQAFARLGDCGKAALPVLHEMLRNHYDKYAQADVVNAIAAAAGEDAGAEMTNIVNDELPYWRHVGPTLKPNWWNDSKDPQWQIHRERYAVLDFALSNLLKEKYPPARQAILSTRQEWSTFTQLNDQPNSVRNEVIDMCDRYLQSIGEPAAPASQP